MNRQDAKDAGSPVQAGGPGGDALRNHRPEDLMEAAGLGLSIVSACLFSALLFRCVATNCAALLLRSAQPAFVSPGTATLPYGPLGFRQGVLVRDPDARALQIIER